MAHVTKIKVRGYHLDFYGHVNNARYLEFLEEARWCLLDGCLDLDQWRVQGRAFAVVNINISYRQPALQGNELEIHSTLQHVGGKCAVIRQEVMRRSIKDRNELEVVAEADITFVVIDLESGKALPLTGEIGQTFEAMAQRGGQKDEN